MADLTTTALVKRQLAGPTGTMAGTDDDLIGFYVTQASDLIERECRRQFSSTIGTLIYDASYPTVDNNTLYAGVDLLGVASLVNGGNGTLTSTQYRLVPLNKTPYYGIELLQSSGQSWTTGSNGYSQNAITVVATLGFCDSTTRPASIAMAATKLAAHLYLNRDNDDSTIRAANGDMLLPPNVPQVVLNVIDMFRRRESYV